MDGIIELINGRLADSRDGITQALRQILLEDGLDPLPSLGEDKVKTPEGKARVEACNLTGLSTCTVSVLRIEEADAKPDDELGLVGRLHFDVTFDGLLIARLEGKIRSFWGKEKLRGKFALGGVRLRLDGDFEAALDGEHVRLDALQSTAVVIDYRRTATKVTRPRSMSFFFDEIEDAVDRALRRRVRRDLARRVAKAIDEGVARLAPIYLDTTDEVPEAESAVDSSLQAQ